MSGATGGPIIFPFLKGTRGGAGVNRNAGGVGPFRPFLKPPTRTTLDTIGIDPDGWRNVPIPKPILFDLRSKFNPLVARGARPLPASGVTLSGVSRDSAGAALGGVTCTLFRVRQQQVKPDGQGTTRYEQVAQTVSDGSGNYSFVVGFDGPYRVTFDLDGSPIRAAITLNTLSGA